MTLTRAGDEAQIAVTDTGIGIPPEFLTRWFERYTQVESGTRREFPGLGLGLALVRYFIEAHGGRVTAESDGEGRGSTFCVVLPLAPP